MSEAADERLRLWQRMGGSGRWGIGVAVDIEAIEARLTALESSRPVQIAQETAADAAKDPERESSSPTSDGPGLTGKEREAIERAADWLFRWQETHGYHSAQDGDLATLRGLLERLG